MHWFDIIVIIILIITFFGGMKEGAVKNFFSLIALIIAIPLAGLSYHLIANLLSFLPGTNWENFFGFFVTMGIISVILHLIFLLPRKIIQKIWKKGILFRLLGGVLNIFGASIGMAVFTLVLRAYPIFDWLERWVSSSAILMWLAENIGFVPAMLPEALQNVTPLVILSALM